MKLADGDVGGLDVEADDLGTEIHEDLGRGRPDAGGAAGDDHTLPGVLQDIFHGELLDSGGPDAPDRAAWERVGQLLAPACRGVRPGPPRCATPGLASGRRAQRDVASPFRSTVISDESHDSMRAPSNRTNTSRCPGSRRACDDRDHGALYRIPGTDLIAHRDFGRRGEGSLGDRKAFEHGG